MSDNLENYHAAVSVSELEDRIAHPVDIGADEIAIILMDGEIYAISNICTHEYACLSDGYVEGNNIVCPLHLAEFDVTTGAAVEEPAEDDLQTYSVKVVDGQVYVKV